MMAAAIERDRDGDEAHREGNGGHALVGAVVQELKHANRDRGRPPRRQNEYRGRQLSDGDRERDEPGHSRGGPAERQRDASESSPPAGAVERGRVEKHLRDGCECRPEDERREGQSAERSGRARWETGCRRASQERPAVNQAAG